MKKSNILLMMIAGVLVLTGCSKTTVCTVELDQSAYTLNSEYKVTYDKDIIKKIETKEEVTSDDEDIIDQFESMINEQLAPYQNLQYYNFNVKRENGKLIETVSIDYTKLDVNKFLEINSEASSLFNDGKIKYDTIISAYTQLGATCK